MCGRLNSTVVVSWCCEVRKQAPEIKRAHKFKNQKILSSLLYHRGRRYYRRTLTLFTVRCSPVITITVTLCRELGTTYIYSSSSSYLCSVYIACKLASKYSAYASKEYEGRSSRRRCCRFALDSRTKSVPVCAQQTQSCSNTSSRGRRRCKQRCVPSTNKGNQAQIALAGVDLNVIGCSWTRSRCCFAFDKR